MQGKHRGILMVRPLGLVTQDSDSGRKHARARYFRSVWRNEGEYHGRFGYRGCIVASFSTFAQSSYQGKSTQRRQAVNSFEPRLLEETEMMK